MDIKTHFNVVGLKGLLSAIKACLTGHPALFKLSRDDCKHAFWLRLPSSDAITCQQVFIDQEYRFDTTTPPEVIIDAGANIGLASIYFANKYPNAKIIAIEPEQSNFKLLKKNTAEYPNIQPIQAALWNTNGHINLIDPGKGKWGFMTENESSSKENICHKVQAITVDKLMIDYKLSKIDLLKVDIEGAEKEVFSNTSAWIEAVNAIIIELHERKKAGCTRNFYTGTNGFDLEWYQGENIFLFRRNAQ